MISLHYFEISKHFTENAYELVSNFSVDIIRKYL